MLLKNHAKTVMQRFTSMSAVQKNRVFVLTAVMSWEPAWPELVLPEMEKRADTADISVLFFLWMC